LNKENPKNTQTKQRKGEKPQKHELTNKVNPMGEEVNIATLQLNGGKQDFNLSKKDFKTGSKGYYANGKMAAGGKNYQISIICVEIGSKPKEKEK
jgi:hypothetical protein